MLSAFLKFTGLSKLGGLLAAAGVFLAVAGAALLKAFTAGRRKEQAKQQAKALKDATKAGEIDEDVTRLSDDELDRELRGAGRKK